MLLKRYSNIEFVLNLDLIDGLELIGRANEEDLNEKRYQAYLMKYQYMTEKDFITFEEYCKPSDEKYHKETDDNRTAEEIVIEAEEILRNMREGR